MSLSIRLRALTGVRVLRATLLTLSAALVALAMFACRDLTTPARLSIAASAVSTPSAPAATGGRVVVTPDSMRGWIFYDDQRSTPCTDATACRLVTGPIGAPSGTGSAELTVPKTPDGKALLLAAYRGVRFAQITTLRYSTFRQSADPSNNLAIALQVNVDYDLADGAIGEQGRIIFEPFQGAAGTVVDAKWQSWDARAGRWWGTKASVMRGNAEVANPCVAASPCTWTQLLARFPNIGVHAASGALLLKAGTHASGFRGNVDALEIGIGGVTTLFDFEAVAPKVVQTYHLRASIGDGVVTSSALPVDTVFVAGSRVPFTLSSRAGRAMPVVILDDSLTATSGTILMDRDHSIEVTSDTLYSYATLTPLERGIADREQALLTSASKPDAELALIEYHMTQLSAGVDPELLARAAAVARWVTFDPVRDSAALRQVKDGLAFTDFYIEDYGQFGGYYLYHADGRYWNVSGQSSPMTPGVVGSRNTLLPPTTALPAGSLASAMTGMRSPILKVGATGGTPLIESVVRTSSSVVSDPEDPKEFTVILFTNGVWNSHDAANASATILRRLLRSAPRFGNGRTVVMLHYNRTASVEIEEYDAAHTCESMAASRMPMLGFNVSLAQLMACKGTRIGVGIARQDLLEVVRLRTAAREHRPSNNADVDSLAKRIRGMRERDFHVLLVGHSEGTLLDVLALQQLPQREGHPLQLANRCVAAVALAPAASRATYGLDEYHLLGTLAKHDILATYGISNPGDWSPLQTDASSLVDVAFATGPPAIAELLQAYLGLKIHDATTYLTGTGGTMLLGQLTRLNRECQPGSATLALSPRVVPAGSVLTMNQTVTNQNGRALYGRRVNPTYDTWIFKQLDSISFRAMTPRQTPQSIGTYINSYMTLSDSISVPILPIQLRVVKNDSSWWIPIAASNGSDANGVGNVSPAPGPVPTDTWGGDVGSCGQIVRINGESTSWVDYKLVCSREYRPIYAIPDTLISGRVAAGVEKWTIPPDANACVSGVACATSLYVIMVDSRGQIIGRSDTVSLPGGSSASRVPEPLGLKMTRLRGGASSEPSPAGATDASFGRKRGLREQQP